MQQPMDSFVAQMVEKLSDDLQEFFQERAGTRQHLAGLAQEHAEALGLLDVIHHFPSALSGVVVIEAQYGDSTEWFVSTSIETARSHLHNTGGIEVGRPDLAMVIEQQYSGMALLTQR